MLPNLLLGLVLSHFGIATFTLLKGLNTSCSFHQRGPFSTWWFNLWELRMSVSNFATIHRALMEPFKSVEGILYQMSGQSLQPSARWFSPKPKKPNVSVAPRKNRRIWDFIVIHRVKLPHSFFFFKVKI